MDVLRSSISLKTKPNPIHQATGCLPISEAHLYCINNLQFNLALIKDIYVGKDSNLSQPNKKQKRKERNEIQ